MEQYARKRFGRDWVLAAAAAFGDPASAEGFLIAWSFYHHLIEGKPVAQWFLEDHADRLSEEERAWLNAQRSAWLSVWETQGVERGRNVTLRDLLTGETRIVWETTASQSLGKRDAILARVVDHQGTSVLCGVYPRSLSPRDAALVAQRVRDRLRRRSRIPVERLRAEPVARCLIGCWEEALAVAQIRASRPPELLITVDHFRFNPADRAQIRQRLASVEGVTDLPDPGDPEPAYVFTKPGRPVPGRWDRTITGRATLSGDTLRLETNSIQRADSLRKLLEELLGPMIRHRAREHADPMAALQESRHRHDVPPKQTPSDEENRVLLEVKARHYEDWLDHPLPALGGKTPRATVRTKAGRQRVDLLLKEMENHESRVPAGQRFDFDSIRRALGLEDEQR